MRWIVFVACVVAALPAWGRFAPSPLKDVLERSEVVADLTITSGREESWGEKKVCGFVYESRVNEQFKGPPAQTLRFASNNPMAVGSRHLIFMKTYSGAFPSDVTIKRPKEEEDKENACLERLPTLRGTWLATAKFIDRDYVVLSYWVVAPPELNPATVEISEVTVDGQPLPYPGTLDVRRPETENLFLSYILGAVVVKWEHLRDWLSKANAR
jgi:hypothetical protein